jgi:hypothetical protein
MSIIIGSATVVNVDNITDGIQSINWSVQLQTNRMWQLGSWNPYRTQVTKSLSCSVTTYAGVLSQVFLDVADSCEDSTAVKSIFINASSCPHTLNTFGPYNMYINGYSYSKNDPNSFATESWNFQLWINANDDGALDNDHFLPVPEPSVVIQGITEGNYSGDFEDSSYMGIIPKTAVDSGPVGYSVIGSQGEVSAGFPGIGNYNEITYCIVESIGGGLMGYESKAQGKTGSSQANVIHTPLYISS